MRIFTTISRFFVGVLFIVSGLVKANDPLGLSYKMQEFFEVWNSDLAASGFFAKASLISFFHFLSEHSLFLSLVMISLEILAGIALIIGWRRNLILRLLMVLIVFFTFLTAYAYGSGKFKNCGCFGDCLPITPLTSLLKDILLLILIIGLWIGRKHIRPLVSPPAAGLAMLAGLLLTIAMQWYVLNYLPFADCLPFKKGNNISQQMLMPAGARPDSFAIRFIYEKQGKRFEFPADKLPADLATYTYVDRVDKLIRKGNAEPPIKGFALTGITGTDSTQAVLQLPAVYILFTENVEAHISDWSTELKTLTAEANKKNIPVYVATSASLTKAMQVLAANGMGNIPVFSCDFTVIRTAARANPTLYYLERGTVKGKYSFNQLPGASSHL